MPYMVTFTINIPQMLVYIPYMDPMGMVTYGYLTHPISSWTITTGITWDRQDPEPSKAPGITPRRWRSRHVWPRIGERTSNRRTESGDRSGILDDF
jgi:hypothetical protein